MSVFDVDLGAVAAPTFVIDQDALRRNFTRLREAAHGVPLRLASKSIRVRSLLEWGLAQDGVMGVLSYSAAEALWLVGHGASEILVAYPSVDVATMRAVAADPQARAAITFMADLPQHVELLAQAACESDTELRVCLDVDASLRLGRKMQVGTHRSSVHTPEEAAEFAAHVAGTPGVQLVGVMMYEAQVAGVGDVTPVHRLIKRRSVADLGGRRHEVVAAVSRHADLEFVNGGGTGSVHLTRLDPTVTDIAVGSGLFSSTHFDHYDDLTTEPASYFVTPVVRKPTSGVAVTFSGGYHASGPHGATRLPKPVWPRGLRYFTTEGAGEVQTPLHGRGARRLDIGDHVWFRHTKAGEACERFDVAHLVSNGQVVEAVPTYRGEGVNFG